MARRILLLLVLAAIATGCGAVNYHNQELGLTFLCPSRWQCEYLDEFPWGQAFICTPRSGHRTQDGCCNSMITISAIPWDIRVHSEPTTAAALLAKQLADSQTTGPDSNIGEIQRTQVGGQDAAFADVTKQDSSGCQQVTRHVLVYVYDRTVSLCACGSMQQWAAVTAALDEILATMIFPLPPTPLAEKLTRQQETVAAVAEVLHTVGPFPEHLMQHNAQKTGEEFDANRFFSVLPHLSMQPGYVLDYVYFYEDMIGEPVLYGRPIDQPPYDTYADYLRALGLPSSTSLRAIQYRYLDHIVTDGSEEAFFELVVLRIMGGQFYQYWHAAYNDQKILCDRAGLEALFAQPPAFTQLPLDIRQKARALDFTPVIEMNETTVSVRVITFTNWGGFIEESYTFRREFPHETVNVEKKTLVEYDCGWNF